MANRAASILLTGASGFLGRYLRTELATRRVVARTAGRSGCDVRLDLADVASIRAALERERPDCIVHAAAIASLPACESDPEAAFTCNALAVEALGAGGARLVQVSTDLVFDGSAAPYARDAHAEPRSVYGRSKLAGEAAALVAGGLVVRVPLLFGRSHDGRRGATDMLRAAAADGRRLGLFVNEFRTPLHAADAARAIVDLALDRSASGVRHVAGPERVSRHELAQRFVRVSGLRGLEVDAIECVDPTRPRDVSLVGDVRVDVSLDERLAAS